MSTAPPASAPTSAPKRAPLGLIGRAALAVVAGGSVWAAHLAEAPTYSPFLQWWLLLVDPVIGLAALFTVLHFGPRHPLAVTLVAAAATLVSEFAFGAAVLAAGGVAARLQWRPTAIAGVVLSVALTLSGIIYPPRDGALELWIVVVFSVLFAATVVAIGLAVGQRRAVLEGLRARAEAAEREQAAREQAARVAERNRIAHDMHDVVAHRISLVALHAGVLEYRADLSDTDRSAAIAAIEENARAALEELRDVLGVLRAPDADAAPGAPNAPSAPDPPQPGLADIATLVADGRAAGMPIEFIADITGDPPLLVSQASYRIVREALSNARKHARGAPVTVSLAGEGGEGLAVRVENAAATPSAASDAPRLPGSGFGLVGLAERVAALGGRFDTGPRPDGGFALSAWLPWAT